VILPLAPGDIHPGPKPVNDSHETVYREPTKICIPHAREISRSYASQAMRFPNGQAIPIERLDNFCGQDRLELLYIRVLFAEIPEHVSAAAHHFKLILFHLNISFHVATVKVKMGPRLRGDDGGRYEPGTLFTDETGHMVYRLVRVWGKEDALCRGRRPVPWKNALHSCALGGAVNLR
jgi:hypothetical protein